GISERSASWLIADPTKLSSASWSSFLSQEEAQNLSLSSQIVGIDPTYHFPRLCDSSDPLIIAHSLPGEDIHLRGTCFNVTVFVSWQCCGNLCSAGKNDSCCAEFGSIPSMFQVEGAFSGSVPFWLTLALGAMVLLLLIICLLLLTLYLHQK